MNKLFLVLALLFALSACTATLGKKCTYTQEGTKISSWVWIYTDGKPIDLDKNNCNQFTKKMLLNDFIAVMNFIFIANDMWMLWTAFILGGAFIWKIKK